MSHYRCLRCGAQVGDMQVHYCPPIDTPLGPSSPPIPGMPWTVTARTLTEEDVRRLIREEIRECLRGVDSIDELKGELDARMDGDTP